MILTAKATYLYFEFFRMQLYQILLCYCMKSLMITYQRYFLCFPLSSVIIWGGGSAYVSHDYYLRGFSRAKIMGTLPSSFQAWGKGPVLIK